MNNYLNLEAVTVMYVRTTRRTSWTPVAGELTANDMAWWYYTSIS